MDFRKWTEQFAGKWQSFSDLPRVDLYQSEISDDIADAWFDSLGFDDLEPPEHEPSNPVHRFLALHLLLQLSRWDYPGDNPDDAAVTRRAALSAYRDALELVHASEVSSTEWVRWEIHASAEGARWARVGDLFDAWRRMSPDDRDIIEQLRARVFWMSVWLEQAGLDGPTNWLPGADDIFASSFESLLLLKSVSMMPLRDAEDLQTPTLSGDPLERTIDAQAALAKVGDSAPKPPLQLGINASCAYMLARARGNDEELVRAASLYQALAKCSTGWSEFPDQLQGIVVNRAYESAIVTLKQARRLGLAESVVREWRAAAGETPVIMEHLAEVQLKQNDIDGASESMLAAIAGNDKYETDWKASLLVALATRRDPFAALESILIQAEALHPAQHGLAEGLVNRYWPNFNALTAETRRLWIHGLLLRHDPAFAAPLGELGKQSAGHAFALALEGELRRSVFDAFVSARAWVKTLRVFPEASKPLVKYAQARGFLTLGQMATSLRLCVSSSDEVLSALRDHVSSRVPHLLRMVQQIDSIAAQRNRVAHEHLDEAGLLSLERNAEAILELVAQSKAEQVLGRSME